jgi:hypothetical protein
MAEARTKNCVVRLGIAKTGYGLAYLLGAALVYHLLVLLPALWGEFRAGRRGIEAS